MTLCFALFLSVFNLLFTAQSLGIPLLQPYLGVETQRMSIDEFEKGLNFAVGGATALNASYLREKVFVEVPTNYSLSVQLEWFRKAYSLACPSSSSTSTSLSFFMLLYSLLIIILQCHTLLLCVLNFYVFQVKDLLKQNGWEK